MILFLAHKWHPDMATRYRRLHEETVGIAPCRLLLQDDHGPVLAKWMEFLQDCDLVSTLVCFEAESLQQHLGFAFLNGQSLTPGSAHYPLMWLARQTQAEYFWIVECDVDYTASWRGFFSAFEPCNAHLLATHLTAFESNPEWHWWPSLRSPSGGTFKVPTLRKAFFPVYRISRQALALVDTLQQLGWQGHFEVLLPTLLAMNGLEVRDMRDVTPCYCGTGIEPWDPETVRSSIRWRPAISDAERKIHESADTPRLLHPIKDEPDEKEAGQVPPVASQVVRGENPRISVVLATWNGAAHLGRQLESIESQRRHPDELIIVDDASSDETLDICKRFLHTTKLNTKLFRQESRVGYERNFSTGVSLANGELLLFCDQDDVWHEEKIGEMQKAFAGGQYDVITHDIRITQACHGDGNESFFRYLSSIGLPRELCIKGHSMGVRSSFLRKLGWPPPNGYSHDLWLALVSSLIGSRGFVDQVLVEHHLHGSNASGWIPSLKDLLSISVEELRSGVDASAVLLDMCIRGDQLKLAALASALAKYLENEHTTEAIKGLATLNHFRSKPASTPT